MTAKKQQPKNSITVYKTPDESDDTATARTLTKPEVQAARAIQLWQGGITDVNAIAGELAKQVGKVNKDNLERTEAMLLAQAHTLDELFNNLVMRAKNQEYMANFETMLRLGLKAQAQCAHTLKVLAEIKNPPIVYAKQANIAAGHQQVNNVVPVVNEFSEAIKKPHAHTGETKNQQNELLTEMPHETLDSNRTGETITANQAMATVE